MRRSFMLLAGAVALVLVGMALGAALDDEEAQQVRPPATTPSATSTPTPPPEGAVSGGRQLTYADGSMIHLGDRAVDTGQHVQSIDVTDEGAVFTRSDGSIWFTDGTAPRRIGATTGGATSTVSDRWSWAGPRWWVATGNSGSLAAWLERQGGGAMNLVVYDTARKGATKVPVTVRDRFHGIVDLVTDQEVFWSEQGDAGDDFYHRYRLGGSSEQVSRRLWYAGMSDQSRRLVVPDGFGDGLSVTDDSSDAHADFPLARFVVRQGWATMPLRSARYSSSREPVRRLRLEDPLRNGTPLWIAEWLDDTRFVLMDEARNLLTCDRRERRCELTVPGDTIGTLVVPSYPT